MALTDISLLFKDIIETDQQKNLRLARDGQTAMAPYTDLPVGLRALSMGTAYNIPNMVESVRQFGVAAGLPVQTQGEQLQGAMGGLTITDPADQAEMVRLLANLGNPGDAAAAVAIFQEANQKQKDRKRRIELETAREARAVEEAGRAASREERASRQETALIAERRRQAERQIEADAMAVAKHNREVAEWEEKDSLDARQQATNDAAKAQVLAILPANDPMRSILEVEDSFVPTNTLSRILEDYKAAQIPKPKIEEVFDSVAGRNMINAYDEITGEYLYTIGEGKRPDRNVTAPNAVQRDAIRDVIRDDDTLTEITLSKGKGWRPGPPIPAVLQEDLLIDLMYKYSEQNEQNLAETVNIIKMAYEDTEKGGRDNLRLGILPTLDWSVQPLP
jgi:hypothetical protein